MHKLTKNCINLAPRANLGALWFDKLRPNKMSTAQWNINSDRKWEVFHHNNDSDIKWTKKPGGNLFRLFYLARGERNASKHARISSCVFASRDAITKWRTLRQARVKVQNVDLSEIFEVFPQLIEENGGEEFNK